MFEVFQNILDSLWDPQRIPVAAIALLISVFLGLLVGPVGGDATPLFWRIMHGLFGGLGKRMDKAGRPRGDLILRGFFIAVAGFTVSFFIGQALATIVVTYGQWGIAEILALSILLSSGALWIALIRLYRALHKGKVEEGVYFVLARTARNNLSAVDDFTITRTGMGLAVRGFDKAIVAPILWYLIFGLTGAYIYAGMMALNWCFGRDGASNGFAVIMASIEKLMGIVPSVISAAFLSLSCAFTPTAMITSALKGWNAHKNKADYAEGGLPLTAVAYGLNVSLGGPATDLDGFVIKRNWVGPDGATAQLEAGHLHRALYCVCMATLLLFLGLIGLMVVTGNQTLDF